MVRFGPKKVSGPLLMQGSTNMQCRVGTQDTRPDNFSVVCYTHNGQNRTLLIIKT